eukprot:RCo020396
MGKEHSADAPDTLRFLAVEDVGYEGVPATWSLAYTWTPLMHRYHGRIEVRFLQEQPPTAEERHFAGRRFVWGHSSPARPITRPMVLSWNVPVRRVEPDGDVVVDADTVLRLYRKLASRHPEAAPSALPLPHEILAAQSTWQDTVRSDDSEELAESGHPCAQGASSVEHEALAPHTGHSVLPSTEESVCPMNPIPQAPHCPAAGPESKGGPATAGSAGASHGRRRRRRLSDVQQEEVYSRLYDSSIQKSSFLRQKLMERFVQPVVPSVKLSPAEMESQIDRMFRVALATRKAKREAAEKRVPKELAARQLRSVLVALIGGSKNEVHDRAPAVVDLIPGRAASTSDFGGHKAAISRMKPPRRISEERIASRVSQLFSGLTAAERTRRLREKFWKDDQAKTFKFTSVQQRLHSARLYDEGLRRREEARARLTEKYITMEQPWKGAGKDLSAEDVSLTFERLYRGEPRS